MEKLQKELNSRLAEIIRLYTKHGSQTFSNKAFLDNLKKADELVKQIARLERN